MAKITVEIKGDERARFKLNQLSLVKTEEIRRLVKETAINVTREAKKKCPVDSGRLRSSIRWVLYLGGLTAEVFTDVFYGLFVEFGTKKMKAQPFLLPAWKGEMPKYLAKLKVILKKPV